MGVMVPLLPPTAMSGTSISIWPSAHMADCQLQENGVLRVMEEEGWEALQQGEHLGVLPTAG